MRMEREQPESCRTRSYAALTFVLSLSALSACDGVLDVELPHQLTDEVLEDPAGAETVVNTIIAHFEDAYDGHTYNLLGREDGGEVYLCGPMCGYFQYQVPNLFFDGMATSLRFANQLREKLEGSWAAADVPKRAEFLAISSIYEGATLGWMGSNLCEVAFDSGPPMSPDETLAMADAALTQALSEIDTEGDFALQNGISPSARNLAYGLRAQVRWMAGDEVGALADAEQVPQGFVAYVTRESGPERRNIGWYSGTSGGFLELADPIDWWSGPPNPVTGQPWPDVIPFTGYTYLGILPDGRAIRDNGIPIRIPGADAINTAGMDENAVPDTRVTHMPVVIQGKQAEGLTPARYDGEDASIPLVNWKDMVLIRAEIQGGQTAIDLVNELRTADHLPLVTYADPGDAEEVRYMIIEERRRALFNEARFYYTKLKNLDILWFPRDVGGTRAQGHNLQGAVRTLMPDDEFIQNPNLTMTDRATLCQQNERPVNP